MHKIQMTSEQALRWCSGTTVWSEFESRVMEAAERVDVSFLSTSHIVTIKDVSMGKIDWM